jgi:hypothetical protein
MPGFAALDFFPGPVEADQSGSGPGGHSVLPVGFNGLASQRIVHVCSHALPGVTGFVTSTGTGHSPTEALTEVWSTICIAVYIA